MCSLPQNCVLGQTFPGRGDNSSIQAEPALVDRMLGDLRTGREPEPGHPSRRCLHPKWSAPAATRRSDRRAEHSGDRPADQGVRGGQRGHARQRPWPLAGYAPARYAGGLRAERSPDHLHPFLNLDRLSDGDVITLTEGAVRHRYAVEGIHIVPVKRYVPYVSAAEEPTRAEGHPLRCNTVTASYQRIVVRARALDGGHGVDS